MPIGNDLSGRPWVIASASEDPLKLGWVKINNIQWIEYDDDEDTCEVQDATGRTLWTGNGHGDLSPVVAEHVLGWVNGLMVPSLDSGRLIIYIE